MCVGAFLSYKIAVFTGLFIVFFALTATQTFGAEAPAHGILPGFQEDEGQIGQAKIHIDMAELPISFIANTGQADANVRFMVKAGTHTVFFTPQEIVFAANRKMEDDLTHSSVVRLRFTGANGKVRVEGEERLPGVANFFLGNDSEQWLINVPTYAAITYKDLYPGIDLIYSGKQGRLKSEFVVAAGADPNAITLDYSGTSGMYVREDGALALETPIGELIEAPPSIYQMIEGERVTVEGCYRLLGEGEVAFTFGDYVPTEPLIFDPEVLYSTYLGGSDEDQSQGITVDGSGNAYITGWTSSGDFPAQNPVQPGYGGGIRDVFVAKLNASGSGLVYSTYLGGSKYDQSSAIAVDATGNAYITGLTESVDFPTKDPLQPDRGGPGDAFIAKLNALGSGLVYSTYLGGGSIDSGFGIAVDNSGNAYATGWTLSTDFPTKYPLQPGYSGSYDTFVAKLNASGSSLVYSTYLGGGSSDYCWNIVVDAAGNAYITGRTDSTDFPTYNPLQPDYGGGDDDAFVAKLNASGSSLVYSTYLGGSNTDAGEDIAVDGSGNAYVTGHTRSIDFPTQNPLQPNLGGGYDGFVAKLTASGSSLVYSTYFGGSGGDAGKGIVVDSSGSAYITGNTNSTDFPTYNPLQPDCGGYADALVVKLSASGSEFVYGSIHVSCW